MDLQTFQTRLRERVGNPSTIDVLDSTLTLRINEAYEDIWDRYRFHAARGTSSAITTVAGTNSYTMPTTADVLMEVRDATNGVKLKKMGRDDWYSLNQGTSTGRPTRYYREGTTLYLDPNPDGAYAFLLLFKKPYTALSGATDSPAIPSSWHQGILLLARYKFWETTGNWAQAQAAMSVYEAWLADKTDEIDEEIFADSSFNAQPEGLGVPLNRLDFDHAD